MNKKATWFLVGFGLTVGVLVLLLTVGPLAGSAQGGRTNPNNANQAQGAPSPSLTTDDPLGRTRIPLANPAAPTANNAVPPSQAGSSVPRTDDPAGRTNVPVPASAAAPRNNQPLSGAPLPQGNAQPAVTAQEERGRTEDVPGSPLVIPGADLRSDGGSPDGIFFYFYGGYMEGSSAWPCVMAPAYLPNGAHIWQMFLSVYDNDPSNQAEARLFRVDNYSGAVDLMGSASTTGECDCVQTPYDDSIDFPDVVYPQYSYYVGACLNSSNIRLYSVRLYYN